MQTEPEIYYGWIKKIHLLFQKAQIPHYTKAASYTMGAGLGPNDSSVHAARLPSHKPV